MEDNISFKERVKNKVIEEAKEYYNVYVQYDYLIYCHDFKEQECYILSAEKENYLHLIGISTNLSAKEFFTKCMNATLNVEDFEFGKRNQDIKMIKGSVRRKINCLHNMNTLFINKQLIVEENFKKNHIGCALATSDQLITVGFTQGLKARPKTLLKGNELVNSYNVDVILRRRRGILLFDEIIYGDINDVEGVSTEFEELLLKNLGNMDIKSE